MDRHSKENKDHHVHPETGPACADPVFWRPDKRGAYRRLEPADVEQLRKEFETRGRTAALEAV